MSFQQLQHLTNVMTDDQFKKFETAVYNLLLHPTIFSRTEIREMHTKADRLVKTKALKVVQSY